MDIAIYQINPERDMNHLKFSSLTETQEIQCSDNIDTAIYDKVYESTIDSLDLEQVYEKFNINTPHDFKGHSLSVSDIIEIKGNDQKGFYYCDSYGFKKIDFISSERKPDKSIENKSTIKVVICEPGKLSEIREIESSLKAMQTVVGGNIEAIYPYKEQVALVCNDEGKMSELPLSRAVYGDNGEMIDIIAGPFFICDCSGEDFGSLTEIQLKRYSKYFRRPEDYLKLNGQILAIPYTPTTIKEYER